MDDLENLQDEESMKDYHDLSRLLKDFEQGDNLPIYGAVLEEEDFSQILPRALPGGTSESFILEPQREKIVALSDDVNVDKSHGSTTKETLEVPPDYKKIIEYTVFDQFTELANDIEEKKFYADKDPFYLKDGGQYDYFIKFDSKTNPYVDTDALNQHAFWKSSFRRVARIIYGGKVGPQKGEEAYALMKKNKKWFVDYLNQQWKKFYKGNEDLERPEWYIKDGFTNKDGTFNEKVKPKTLGNILITQVPNKLSIILGPHNQSKKRAGNYNIFRGSTGEYYFDEGIQNKSTRVRIWPGDKLGLYDGPTVQDAEDNGNLEGGNVEDAETMQSSLVHEKYLNTKGYLNHNVEPKTLYTVLKSPKPQKLTMYFSSGNKNFLPSGRYNVMKKGNKYYFTDAPSRVVKIWPGDKIEIYDEKYEGAEVVIPESIFLSKYRWLVANNELYAELHKRYGSKVPSLLMYLNTTSYRFQVGKKSYAANFNFGARNNLNLIRGILETQKYFSTITSRSGVCKKYEKNIKEFIEQPDDFSKIFYVGARLGHEDHNGAFSNLPNYERELKKVYPKSDFDDYSSNTNLATTPDKLVNTIVNYCQRHPEEQILCSLNLHGGKGGGLGYNGHIIWPRHLKQLAGQNNLMLDVDACYGLDQIAPLAKGATYIGVSSGMNSATYNSTETLIAAYKNNKGDYTGDGRVSHNEARFYQMMHYQDSLTYTAYKSPAHGNAAIPMANFPGRDGGNVFRSESQDIGSLENMLQPSLLDSVSFDTGKWGISPFTQFNKLGLD